MSCGTCGVGCHVGRGVGCHVGHEVGYHVGHEVGYHVGHNMGCQMWDMTGRLLVMKIMSNLLVKENIQICRVEWDVI